METQAHLHRIECDNSGKQQRGYARDCVNVRLSRKYRRHLKQRLARLLSKETRFPRSSIPHLHCRSTTVSLTCFDQERRRLSSIQVGLKQKWLIRLRARQLLLLALRSFRASVGTALSHSHQSSSRILLLQSVSGRKRRSMRSDVYSSLRSRHQSGRPHTKAQCRDEMKHAEWAGHGELHRSRRSLAYLRETPGTGMQPCWFDRRQ